MKPPSERQRQSAFHQAFEIARDGTQAEGFAVCNEANAPITRGALAQLRQQGLRPGVADYLIVWRVGEDQHRIGWLEFKADRGRQSEPQRAFEAAMTVLGVPYAVVRSVDEAMAAVEAWGVPMWRVWRDGALVCPSRASSPETSP